MASVDQTIRVYEELSEWYERQGQAKLRDWFLVLAADASLSAGRKDEAERFRARLLQINPHHLLKPFPSMADALKSPDVQGYVVELRRAYPPQAAEQLLESQKATAAMAPPRGPASTNPKPADKSAEKRAPAAPAAEEEAPLKVYRGKNMPEESRPPAKPLSSWEPSAPAPKPPAKMVPPPPPAAPAQRARPNYAAAPIPAPPPRRRPDDLDSSQGRWVSSFLFGVMLLFALLLGGYCFARPFLPAAWIPF